MFKGLVDNEVSEDNLRIRYMRTIVFNGGPIDNGTVRFDNVTDREDEQRD
jgi:hypothetical protein